ncbi:TadE/TadG family type IV pilus assembly protein [Sphingomonas sp. LB2R24]|uniref:TadE/TadG family type IV pilus assembly protein n=1 Tax=Sphingomonas sorbitolis TaxID=3096165 RepID=UPI002FC6C020
MIKGNFRKFALRFYRDRAGLALIEFALSAPIVLLVGCYGVELANLAIVHMRVSQIALNLADNASRVGAYSNLATQQLREVDVNDILQAARYQGAGISLTANGRITLSSLENVAQSYDTQPVQRIHWQRCIGAQSGTSFDGQFKANVATTAGSTATVNDKGYDLPLGISDNGSTPIMAPGGAGVMYVEINYRTKPLFGAWLAPPRTIHYIASFVVRDRRDYSQMYNPTPTSTPSTCNLYTQ